MYRLLCETCSEDQFFEGFESAQAEFVRHADDRHEVELVRLKNAINVTKEDPLDGKSTGV